MLIEKIAESKRKDRIILRRVGLIFALPLAGSLVSLVSCGFSMAQDSGNANVVNPAIEKFADKLDSVDKKLSKDIEEIKSSGSKQTDAINELITSIKEKQKTNKRVAERELRGAEALKELHTNKNISPERREELTQIARDSLNPISLDEPVNLYASLKEKERVLLADLEAAERQLKLYKISFSDLDSVRLVLTSVKEISDKINAIEDQLQDQERRVEIAKDDLDVAEKEN